METNNKAKELKKKDAIQSKARKKIVEKAISARYPHLKFAAKPIAKTIDKKLGNKGIKL